VIFNLNCKTNFSQTEEKKIDLLVCLPFLPLLVAGELVTGQW